MSEDTTHDPSVEESNSRKGENDYTQLLQDGRITMQQLQNVALQSLQNAVETANLCGKQGLNVAALNAQAGINAQALATNKMWNVEISEAAAQAGVIHAAGMGGIGVEAMRSLMTEFVANVAAASQPSS